MKILKTKKHFPKIGMRILKTGFAVFFLLSLFRILKLTRTPFYAVIATILCMQADLANSKKTAVNRTIGTTIGASYALLLTILEVNFHLILPNTWLHIVCISLGIMAIIYSTVLLGRTGAAFISCVVFLSVVIISRGDMNPYEFVFFRFLDTLSGVALAYFVNWIHLPRRRQKDILFVSGLDDTLISVDDQMSAFSKRELNQLLDDGVNFTISTCRTPAALMEVTKNIPLRLPVIAMHGTVLYDTRENRYLLKYIIPHETVRHIEQLMEAGNFHFFENVILDDVLLIYSRDFRTESQRNYYESLRKSPYRNYIHSPRPYDQDVVYFTLLDDKEKLITLKSLIEKQSYAHTLRFILKENQFENQAILYILCKNATKENMIYYLQQMLHLDKTVTFGSIEGKYDVVVHDQNMDLVVKTVKKMYEPFALFS